MSDAAPTTPLLAADGVHFRYRGASTDVLDGVDVSVSPGASLGLVGESGAGKSTLLKVLLGLARPTSGRVLFEGSPVDPSSRAGMRRFRSSVQTVFQDPYSSLDPRMTVARSIAEPLHSLGLAGSARETASTVASLLESVGLPADAADRYPAAFSGGQRQRIAIARALAPQPRVLVADEPVSALDMSVRVQVIELLRRLSLDREFALVLVSHDLTIVAALCQNIAVLERGRIVETGATDAVLADPRDAYTQRLLSSVPRLP